MTHGPYLVRRRKMIVERYCPATGEVARGLPADLPPFQGLIVFLWRGFVTLLVGIAASIVGGAAYLLWESVSPLWLVVVAFIVLILGGGFMYMMYMMYMMRIKLFEHRHRRMRAVIDAYRESRRSDIRGNFGERSTHGSATRSEPEDPPAA
jgi:hypothetical protein